MDIISALTFDGGLVGSCAILLDGSNLKGPKLKNNKEFKVTKMGVCEAHEVI